MTILIIKITIIIVLLIWKIVIIIIISIIVIVIIAVIITTIMLVYVIYLAEDCCRVKMKLRAPNQIVLLVWGHFSNGPNFKKRLKIKIWKIYVGNVSKRARWSQHSVYVHRVCDSCSLGVTCLYSYILKRGKSWNELEQSVTNWNHLE